MLGIDIFGVISGALGLLGMVVSAWHACAPAHRLRALDRAITACECLLVSIHEECIAIDVALADKAAERVFM
jgi:hypothetical protein